MADSAQIRTRTRVRLPALLRCLLVVATAAAGAASAAAQELTTILRYEPLAGLAVTEPDTTASGYVIGSTTLSFTAFGTRFVMVLTSNDALTANLPAEVRQRLGATMFYTGTLRGNADSWIRLTRTATELTGAMWDGEELFIIEQFERVAARVVAGPDLAPTAPIIYRWSDTLSALTDTVMTPAASGGAGSQKPATAPAVFAELATLQGARAPSRMLDIGFIADSEFVEAEGRSRAEALMLGIANTIDGIFADQAGVRIRVAELRTFGPEPDAFTGTDPSALLNQVESFKVDTPEFRGQGLVHLLTGRNLDERPGTPAGARLLGVARLGSVCDERLAVSITEYYPQGTPALVVAHEIAHNLGAPHDQETGSACESAPDGFIMTPFFNGGRQFSQCSLDQMALKLAAANCLVPNPSFALIRAVPSAEVVRPGGPVEIDWTVMNQGQISATGVRAEFDLHMFDVVEIQTSNGSVCSIPDPLHEHKWMCPIGTVGAGAAVSFKLRLRALDWIVPLPGYAADGSASLKLVAAEPVFNYRNSWTVDHVTVTRHLSDMYSELSLPASAEAGSKISVTLRGGNRGPDEVQSAVAWVEASSRSGLTFDAATTARGSCASVSTGAMVCRFGTLAVGDNFEIVVEATVGPEGDYEITGGSSANESWDVAYANNEHSSPFRATVTPPPPLVVPPPAPVVPPAPPAPAAAALPVAAVAALIFGCCWRCSALPLGDRC